LVLGAVIALACATLAVGGAPIGAAAEKPLRVDGTSSFLQAARAAGLAPATSALPAKRAAGLTSWSGSFTRNGTTWPYTMLGTDPAAGSKTTKLRMRILPLRLTFDDGGATLDGTETVHDVLRSPIFKRASYRSGNTQYADAMQRAQFWDRVQTSSRRYHVLLTPPKVLPTLTLQVPADGGNSFETANGPAGLVKTSYLVTLLPLLENYTEPNSVLTVVVKDVTGEGFLGFHFSYTLAGTSIRQTVIFTGVFTPSVVVPPAIADVYVLSHEVAEWINDPYLNNIVPAWQDPSSGTCFSNLLEVGDPVEFLPGHSFEVAIKGHVFHLTDVAGLSWFAHDVPSHELGGAYSYDGNLTTFSADC
jgi:hypothetical protein